MEIKPPITQACGVCMTSSWMLDQDEKLICLCCFLMKGITQVTEELENLQSGQAQSFGQAEYVRLKMLERNVWKLILDRDRLAGELAALKAKKKGGKGAGKKKSVPTTAQPQD